MTTKTAFVILVTGSRDWTDRKVIAEALDDFPPGTVLVHGAARGADRIAGDIGQRLGFDVKPEPADWATYGKAAGPIRNQRMLDTWHPDVVMAFHNDLAASKGTGDMVKRAEAVGVPVRRYTSDNDLHHPWLLSSDEQLQMNLADAERQKRGSW